MRQIKNWNYVCLKKGETQYRAVDIEIDFDELSTVRNNLFEKNVMIHFVTLLSEETR